MTDKEISALIETNAKDTGLLDAMVHDAGRPSAVLALAQGMVERRHVTAAGVIPCPGGPAGCDECRSANPAPIDISSRAPQQIMGLAATLDHHDLVERLAALEHERWSHWMRYLFTKGHDKPDGSFVIEPESARRWWRQMSTPYAELSEPEKESDRAEVRKTLAALQESP